MWDGSGVDVETMFDLEITLQGSLLTQPRYIATSVLVLICATMKLDEGYESSKLFYIRFA